MHISSLKVGELLLVLRDLLVLALTGAQPG